MSDRTLPLVSQLQAAALDRHTTASELLRRAKIVATKLKAETALSWIGHEINGYAGVSNYDLPKYRVVTGSPKFLNPYRGWCPIVYGEDDAELVSTAHVKQPVGELENLISDSDSGRLQASHNPELTLWLCNQIGFPTKTIIQLPRSAIWGIVDKAKTLVVDWTLELEAAGIMGENLSFSDKDREKGGSVTNNYFAHNIGVAGGMHGGVAVANQEQALGDVVSIEAVRGLRDQVAAAVSFLPADVGRSVSGSVTGLGTELSKTSPDKGKIKGFLLSIKSACESASGNLIAMGVVEGVKKVVGA